MNGLWIVVDSDRQIVSLMCGTIVIYQTTLSEAYVLLKGVVR